MRLVLLLSLLVFPHLLIAGPKHMISFGRDGLGWSGIREDIKTQEDSSFHSVDYILSDIGLNYAYRLTSRLQLGVFYQGVHSEYEFDSKNSGTQSVQIESNTTGLFFHLNFSDDLNDSWYSGLGFSITSYEEENSKALEEAESKSPFELDDISNTYELILGKRFSLRGFNVANLAFSPQLKIFRRSHGKDFDDQRIRNGTGLTVQPLRFDLLF
jgi:hypothetical protein